MKITQPTNVDSGFDAGDDNKLQKAMLENLEQTYAEQVASGHTEEAKNTKIDIDALKAHMDKDHTSDPLDKSPDDLDI